MNKELLDEKITAAFSELVIDKALVRALKIREKRTILACRNIDLIC